MGARLENHFLEPAPSFCSRTWARSHIRTHTWTRAHHNCYCSGRMFQCIWCIWYARFTRDKWCFPYIPLCIYRNDPRPRCIKTNQRNLHRSIHMWSFATHACIVRTMEQVRIYLPWREGFSIEAAWAQIGTEAEAVTEAPVAVSKLPGLPPAFPSSSA